MNLHSKLTNSFQQMRKTMFALTASSLLWLPTKMDWHNTCQVEQYHWRGPSKLLVFVYLYLEAQLAVVSTCNSLHCTSYRLCSLSGLILRKLCLRNLTLLLKSLLRYQILLNLRYLMGYFLVILQNHLGQLINHLNLLYQLRQYTFS